MTCIGRAARFLAAGNAADPLGGRTITAKTGDWIGKFFG